MPPPRITIQQREICTLDDVYWFSLNASCNFPHCKPRARKVKVQAVYDSYTAITPGVIDPLLAISSATAVKARRLSRCLRCKRGVRRLELFQRSLTMGFMGMK